MENAIGRAVVAPTLERPILVVDDDALNLEAMRQVLGASHRLVFARSGREALAAVEKHDPVLVLLDVQMPEMDGYTVARALKARAETAHVPIIFVSSLSDVGDEALGFEAGGVDYIVKPLCPPIVLARVRTHLSLVQASQLEQSYADAIFMLGAAGHYNDTDTGVHIWRMAAYAGAIAGASGWRGERRRAIELAAPMHDMGKMGIPESILRKPAKLDANEWTIMKTHTRIGYEILRKSKAPVFKLAAEVALRHHERWDGTGYPDGLAGDAIPESARIVALADVFDALTMKRPYKEPWPIERAVAEIKSCSGTHFDPRLVELFGSVLPEILDVKKTWDAKEHIE